MKTTRIALAILLAAFAVPAAAQTTVYKWTDKDGKVHFSDTLPPADVSATQKSMGGGESDDSQLPYGTQMASRRYPVTVYTTANCADCASGRALLEQRGVPYTERDPEASGADQEALKKLIGALYIPTLAVGDNVIKGWQVDQWNSALDSAGYPSTRVPGLGSMRRNPKPAEASAK
jgi:glutaredoxin